MINLPQIYQAWKTNLDWLAVTPELREIFEARLSICEGCQHFTEKYVWGKVYAMLEGRKRTNRQKEFSTYMCELCGCKSTMKISSLSSICPLTIKDNGQLPKWLDIKLDSDGKVIDSGLPK